MKEIKYKFYATILDAYQDYLDSDLIYEKYWGNSDNPPCTSEEFHAKQFQSLIDRINRVPYENDAVTKGTAFNEVIDCMVMHRNSDKIKVERVYEVVADGLVDPCNGKVVGGDCRFTDKVEGLNVTYKEKTFYFPMSLIMEFAEYYKGAVPQVYVQAELGTMYGNVLLYGYIDYEMPFCTHDLKTSSRYAVGNYKRHWQHLVYPYALIQNGCNVYDFEYNVAEIGKSYYRTYTESYTFNEERDVPRLTLHCEDFIRFLNGNSKLITDKKIFNKD